MKKEQIYTKSDSKRRRDLNSNKNYLKESNNEIEKEINSVKEDYKKKILKVKKSTKIASIFLGLTILPLVAVIVLSSLAVGSQWLVILLTGLGLGASVTSAVNFYNVSDINADIENINNNLIYLNNKKHENIKELENISEELETLENKRNLTIKAIKKYISKTNNKKENILEEAKKLLNEEKNLDGKKSLKENEDTL